MPKNDPGKDEDLFDPEDYGEGERARRNPDDPFDAEDDGGQADSPSQQPKPTEEERRRLLREVKQILDDQHEFRVQKARERIKQQKLNAKQLKETLALMVALLYDIGSFPCEDPSTACPCASCKARNGLDQILR